MRSINLHFTYLFTYLPLSSFSVREMNPSITNRADLLFFDARCQNAYSTTTTWRQVYTVSVHRAQKRTIIFFPIIFSLKCSNLYDFLIELRIWIQYTNVTDRRTDGHSVLPRDVTRKRGLCCRLVSVRPSVCHVRVLYPDGWRYRQTSFSAQ